MCETRTIMSIMRRQPPFGNIVVVQHIRVLVLRGSCCIAHKAMFWIITRASGKYKATSPQQLLHSEGAQPTPICLSYEDDQMSHMLRSLRMLDSSLKIRKVIQVPLRRTLLGL